MGQRAVWLGLLALGMSACRAHNAHHAEIDAQLAALTARVAALEQGEASAAPASPQAEELAQALYREAKDAAEHADYDRARRALDELTRLYPSAKVAPQAARLSQEVALIGQPIGPPPEILFWFSGGPGDLHLDQGITLVVFFEQWCPHCERELPRLVGFTEAAGQPVEVLALTRITKSSTIESTQALLLEQGITYAVAQEDGTLFERALVYGIPAALVVRDGVVLWRGHPALLNEQLWLKLLSS